MEEALNCVKPIRIFDKTTGGSLQVPCGRCIACRINYASIWSMRMMHEKKFHDKSAFVTLTYEDAKLPIGGTLVKRDVQLFMKKLRKNTGKKVRYFLAGEYGDKYKRPHYHMIVYGLGKEDENVIASSWGNGYVFVGTVTDDSTNYVARYITKKLTGDKAIVYKEKGIIPEFSFMSKKPGIGSKFIERYGNEIKSRMALIVKGKKVAIPKYYKSKLFVEVQDKEKLEKKECEYRKSEHEKDLDLVKKIGYNAMGKKIIDNRSAIKNNLEARLNLKKRRTL